LLLFELNRQLLYYYFLYILYTALIANYYHFYITILIILIIGCAAVRQLIILFTFLSVGPKGPYLLFYYTTYFLLFTFSYLFIINFKYTHTYTHHPLTSTHRFCSATLSKSCWVLNTLYTLYTGRSVCVCRYAKLLGNRARV
jgi:hypothetical protein